VVVLWYQRAVGYDGRRLDTPVLGLCHVRDGRLARAQMFYFDTADVVRFPAAGNLALDRENPIPKRRRWSQADVLNVGTMPGGKPLPATRKSASGGKNGRRIRMPALVGSGRSLSTR
jgi:hypothetical protein